MTDAEQAEIVHDTDCELPHRPNWEVARIEAAGGHPCQCHLRMART